MNITFNKRNKVVQEKMEMLAVELGVSVNELMLLSFIKFINSEVETANINEKLMYSSTTMERYRKRKMQPEKFYNKNY